MTVTPWRRLLGAETRPEQVRAVAASAGWVLLDEYPPDDTGQPLELVWAVPGMRGDVHYIHDTWAGIDYLFRGTGDLHEVTAEIDRVFDIVDEPEMEAALSSPDPATRSWGVMAVALSAARVLPGALQNVIRQGLHDVSAQVRLRSATAAGYTGDPAWIAELEAMAADEPDVEAAEEALRIAEGLALG